MNKVSVPRYNIQVRLSTEVKVNLEDKLQMFRISIWDHPQDESHVQKSPSR